MSGAELAARRTAAAAALGDFRRAVLAGLAGGADPDWASWAHRLGCELSALIDMTWPEPGTDTAALAAVRAVLDAFDWDTDDRQLALERIDQIALDKAHPLAPGEVTP